MCMFELLLLLFAYMHVSPIHAHHVFTKGLVLITIVGLVLLKLLAREKAFWRQLKLLLPLLVLPAVALSVLHLPVERSGYLRANKCTQKRVLRIEF